MRRAVGRPVYHHAFEAIVLTLEQTGEYGARAVGSFADRRTALLRRPAPR